LGELERGVRIAHRPAAVGIAAAEFAGENGPKPGRGDALARLDKASELAGGGQELGLGETEMASAGDALE